MFLFLFYQLLPFDERNDNIFKQNKDDIIVTASGSIGQYYNSSCHQTYPEHLVDSVVRKTDWCSNINKTKTDYPWISVHMNHKKMLVTGYAIRAGCCYYDCCCMETGQRIYCCCDLYSWSLQGSNDNSTWTTLHKVEADKKFYDCANRVYEVKNTGETYKFIRIIQDEPWPGCNYCMCLNKLELYGKTDSFLFDADSDNDEAVSIIGKVSQNNNY